MVEQLESGRNENGVFLPLLLTILAVTGWFAFQTTQLIAERSQIANLRSAQTSVYENGQKLRQQLDALATGTQRLADAGNANAAEIVTALRQRGVTINPNNTGTR